jgi:copper chaperone CopZ
MSCDHCASSVREEVPEVDGVRSVDVDGESGRPVVDGAGFGDDAIRTAVEDAGYQLAG